VGPRLPQLELVAAPVAEIEMRISGGFSDNPGDSTCPEWTCSIVSGDAAYPDEDEDDDAHAEPSKLCASPVVGDQVQYGKERWGMDSLPLACGQRTTQLLEGGPSMAKYIAAMVRRNANFKWHTEEFKIEVKRENPSKQRGRHRPRATQLLRKQLWPTWQWPCGMQLTLSITLMLMVCLPGRIWFAPGAALGNYEYGGRETALSKWTAAAPPWPQSGHPETMKTEEGPGYLMPTRVSLCSHPRPRLPETLCTAGSTVLPNVDAGEDDDDSNQAVDGKHGVTPEMYFAWLDDNKDGNLTHDEFTGKLPEADKDSTPRTDSSF